MHELRAAPAAARNWFFRAWVTTAQGQPTHLVILAEDLKNAVELPLSVLHGEIARCRVCEPTVDGFQKPPHLDRGGVGRVMVIGQGPGSAELSGTRAFAGQSGRTLEQWLVACGADPASPRAGIYFTSVIKCVCPSERFFSSMARNCRAFLQRQIVELGPDLIITLGRKSYEALSF